MIARRFSSFASACRKMASGSLSTLSAALASTLTTFGRLIETRLLPWLRRRLWLPLHQWASPKLRPIVLSLNERGKKMIGPLEKGMEAAKLATPPEGAYEGVDLSVLPKYISYRAALLHGKLTHQYIILILACIVVVQECVHRYESYALHERLRQKEYILAPGVQDFTPASPQTVSEDYVNDAVDDFISKLGNVSAGSIDSQYKALESLMSPQLKIKFGSEAEAWKAQVKSENIAELLTVGDREITPNGEGFYRVVVTARRDRYLNNEYVGHNDEVIEMTLQLVAPKRERKWFIQINSLVRSDADLFRKKQKTQSESK